MDTTQKRRVGAFIIDVMIICLLSAFTENIVSTFNDEISFNALGLTLNHTFSFSVLYYVSYFLLFDQMNHGITIGKMLLKIMVVFQDKTELPKAIRLKRSLLKIISILILPITVLLFFLNKYFTIHDHFNQTITIPKP